MRDLSAVDKELALTQHWLMYYEQTYPNDVVVLAWRHREKCADPTFSGVPEEMTHLKDIQENASLQRIYLDVQWILKTESIID